MMGLLVALVVAASFPLPSLDGKPLAVTAEQRRFRIPWRYDRVKQFYVEQLGQRAEVTFSERRVQGSRELRLTWSGPGATWAKATLREGESETIIEVVPVMRLDEEQVTGTAKPLVEFIFGRSPDVQRALDSIDHTDHR